MRNLYCILLSVCFTISASAQKVYFVYLQTDNYDPFYVKLNDQIFSSSKAGYLVLSNLRDSLYNFSVGFPSSSSESKFSVPLNRQDRGFLIKSFDSGLGLFDLQSLSIIKAQKEEADKTISYQKRNDDFSFLLSKAAKDTSLLYAVVRIKEDVSLQKQEPQPEAQQKIEEPFLSKDTVAVKPMQTEVAIETKKQESELAETNQEVKKQDTIAGNPIQETLTKDSAALSEQKPDQSNFILDTLTNKALDSLKNNTAAAIADLNTTGQDLFKRSQVKKHSESSTSEGFGLVFYDIYDEGQDTIRLLIPNPPISLKSIDQDSSELQKEFIHVDELKKDTVQQIPIVVAVKNNTPEKSRCKSVASSNDFFKLRKNMAAENTDEAMVAEAKKLFKTKCFTTEQIKNLSALFLTSSGKYQFFDAAYLHVSDQEHFSLLESEIKDDYYLKRFKALVGN